MTDVALLDLDLFAFRCAASAENDSAEVAILRCDKWIRETLYELDQPQFRGFLTGKNNFRYILYPEYKANRKDKPKPKYLQDVRDFLQREWLAEVCDGFEADDALAMCDGIKVSNDKDLLQLVGTHYNPVKKEFTEIGEFEGIYNLYTQMLVGDKSDNVPGFDGMARASVPKFIQTMLDNMTDYEQEIFDVYHDKYQYLINYNLLRMWTKPNDYVIPECLVDALIGQNLYKPEQEVTADLLHSTKSYLSQLSEHTA